MHVVTVHTYGSTHYSVEELRQNVNRMSEGAADHVDLQSAYAVLADVLHKTDNYRGYGYVAGTPRESFAPEERRIYY